jgi:ATP/maltotriose-dependent transcriptional regulator MalT
MYWALRLCVALYWFWDVHGYGREGLGYLMQALAAGAGVGAALRTSALVVAANLAFIYARNLSLEQMAEESLLLYQELGDPQRLGFVRYLQARLLFVQHQDQPRARQLAEQSLAHFRVLGETPFSILALGLLGLIHLEQGELNAARLLLEDSLALGPQPEAVTDTVHVALGLARLSAAQGEAEEARRLYRENLSLLVGLNVYQEGIAANLEGLAAMEAEQEAPRQAARLWGAAEALREAIGAPMYPVYRGGYEHALTQAHAQLGEQTFRTAWAEGRLMTPEQALAALEQEMSVSIRFARALSPPAMKSSTPPFGLTARELEVLRLLAQGLSDAQIAERLVISPRTVNHHTTSLYSKLGVSSRAAATRFAHEQHLL